MEKQEKIKPNGIMTFKRNDKAPEFILGTMVITPSILTEWCERNSQYLSDYKGESQLKLTVMSGQYGLNICVDTWKPTNKDNRSAPELAKANEQGHSQVDINSPLEESFKDLPF